MNTSRRRRANRSRPTRQSQPRWLLDLEFNHEAETFHLKALELGVAPSGQQPIDPTRPESYVASWYQRSATLVVELYLHVNQADKVDWYGGLPWGQWKEMHLRHTAIGPWTCKARLRRTRS